MSAGGNELGSRLTAFGFEPLGELFAFERLTQLDRRMRIGRWRQSDRAFLVTHGCGAHTRNTRLQLEFVIAVEEPEKYFLDLINFVAYFQMTLRDVMPTDVLEIGSSFDAVRDYTHIYASVPFFLPPDVNSFVLGDRTQQLLWLMPLRAFEAKYIAQHGPDAFEAKLEYFGLDFFADRADPSYLDR